MGKHSRSKVARLIEEYGLPAYDAGVLTAPRDLAEFYESAVTESPAKAARGVPAADFGNTSRISASRHSSAAVSMVVAAVSLISRMWPLVDVSIIPTGA